MLVHHVVQALLVQGATGLGRSSFNLSNALGDGMVLQRAPLSAIVWGFGLPGMTIDTRFQGATFSTVVGVDGIWRQRLPPTEATSLPTTIVFVGSDGTSVALNNILFGDVYLCGGQVIMESSQQSVVSSQ